MFGFLQTISFMVMITVCFAMQVTWMVVFIYNGIQKSFQIPRSFKNNPTPRLSTIIKLN